MSNADKDILKDFKWIQEEGTPDRPVFEETPVVNRSIGSLLMKKFCENALVPIGLLATTACLVMGLANMGKGDSRKQQLYMRGRVFFQALTFLAMGGGAMAATVKGQDKKKMHENLGEDKNKNNP